jgi:hypothetical protein
MKEIYDVNSYVFVGTVQELRDMMQCRKEQLKQYRER